MPTQTSPIPGVASRTANEVDWDCRPPLTIEERVLYLYNRYVDYLVELEGAANDSATRGLFELDPLACRAISLQLALDDLSALLLRRGSRARRLQGASERVTRNVSSLSERARTVPPSPAGTESACSARSHS